ncbi:MAG: DegT/DnrJ/EryC1/StrS family aminotransferase [Planctomycetota bacterium]|nr:MAG: DegT/DnrJ/EryC1/StrS family aminotransferase [Planctomycetota bacterium]
MSTVTSTRDQPALLGGTPAVDLDQQQANQWPIITEADEQAVLDVLRSGRLSVNDVVTQLERDYCRWLGVGHAVAHCNGTSAILAALHGFGLVPGDEVIVPSATYWASVTPVLHCGGIPVFAETEDQCLGLDPADVEQKITDRTRAIVVVHLFGMPSRMDELLDIARRHNLRVLEDASHAHGASYHGRPIGTLADAAVFSMQTNKLCPAGEGGMFVTDDTELWERVVRLGHYERVLGLESPNRRFAATGFGLKLRISPLNAAVAGVQLRHLPQRNSRRSRNIIRLSRRLEDLGFRTFLSPPDVERVYFEFLVGYDETATGLPIGDLVKALVAEGAHVERPRYPLLHQQPLFTEGHWANVARLEATASRPLPTYEPTALPRTSAANGSLVKLPSFPQATDALLDQYADAFEKTLRHADTLPRTAP